MKTNLTYIDRTFANKEEVAELLEQVRKDNVRKAELNKEFNKSYRVIDKLFGLAKAN